MKKFDVPYGVSSFTHLRYSNYIYIDKTHFIEKLEKHPSPYTLLLRPRRFGKSLFASMLSCYYDINQKDNFENLFGGTFIGKNPTKYKNSYHILSFNFSGLRTDNKEILEESFTEVVKESLDKFIKDYNLNFEYNKNTFVS